MKNCLKNLLPASFILLLATSCELTETDPQIRSKIDYSALSNTTAYDSFFVDDAGFKTVDLKSGNDRLNQFQALNYYLGDAIRANKTLDANVLKNLFSNSSNPFVDIETLKIIGLDLNTSGVQLRNATASSLSASEAESARFRLESAFGEMADLSKSQGQTASIGVPGRLGNYLVDAKGIETAQIIQKSLIGAFQVDYISNILLSSGLDLDNTIFVAGKNYTALEHNWDEAFGILTLNPIYLEGSSDAAKGSSEYFLGSYLWEYNKPAYPKFQLAFLKGRAAIVNNDKTELNAQADFIKAEIEKTMAAAAIGYLNKWKTGTTDAARAHAIGEALGFIYSLRYCKVNGGTAEFSDAILNSLLNSENGFWDLTAAKINPAIETITTKFKL